MNISWVFYKLLEVIDNLYLGSEVRRLCTCPFALVHFLVI
jgi:hypothetical protein